MPLICRQTPPTAPPDFEGQSARCWRVPRGTVPDAPPDWDACIDAWLVHAPLAHPVWHWWRVDMIHLRDIPGVRPAVKHYPEAGYEFAIWTLNSEKPLPLIDGDVPGAPMSVLHPQDVCEQFHGVDDVQARQICELAIGAIARGDLSPDQDYRTLWAQVIATTVEHTKLGLHEPA